MSSHESAPAADTVGGVRPEHVETVVVGAGQAGLATAYHLARRGRECLVLEGSARIGDVWRDRFDSLRLYSPARYDGLPGMGFPAPPRSYPAGREVGDFLEAYARRFALPVRTGVRADRVARTDGGYVVEAGGRRIEADHVVVATGTWQSPRVPGFAADLDPGIRQLHSAEYRNPSQLLEGPVLVVGASHSGSDVAYEVAATHPTVLSGRIHGQIPFPLDGRRVRLALPVAWFLVNHVLTVRTPLGRKARPEIRSHGGPLIRHRREDLRAAGVELTEARTVGVDDGRPVLADGRVLDVANVVWCTGFGTDLSWLDVPLETEDGWPVQSRGVVPSAPGLYFVGLPFLYAFASMLTGGVGRDAAYVVKHLTRQAARTPRPAPPSSANPPHFGPREETVS